MPLGLTDDEGLQVAQGLVALLGETPATGKASVNFAEFVKLTSTAAWAIAGTVSRAAARTTDFRDFMANLLLGQG